MLKVVWWAAFAVGRWPWVWAAVAAAGYRSGKAAGHDRLRAWGWVAPGGAVLHPELTLAAVAEAAAAAELARRHWAMDRDRARARLEREAREGGPRGAEAARMLAELDRRTRS